MTTDRDTVPAGLRRANRDENRCNTLGGGLEPARGFIPAGGLSGRRLALNRLPWAFHRAPVLPQKP